MEEVFGLLNQVRIQTEEQIFRFAANLQKFNKSSVTKSIILMAKNSLISVQYFNKSDLPSSKIYREAHAIQ